MAQRTSDNNRPYDYKTMDDVIADITELYSMTSELDSNLSVTSITTTGAGTIGTTLNVGGTTTLSGTTNIQGQTTIGSSTNTGNILGVNDLTGGKGLKFTNNVNSNNYQIMGATGHYTVVGHAGDFDGLWGAYGTNGKKIEINNATFAENINIDAASANLNISGGAITFSPSVSINIASLPTSDAGLSTGDLFTQTATQLGGSGTVKVLCVK